MTRQPPEKIEIALAKKKPDPKEQASAPDRSVDASEPEEDFETLLMQIETTVSDLESGRLSLNESLQRYETAVSKMRSCYDLLSAAEQKIQRLSGVDEQGQAVLRDITDSVTGGGTGLAEE
ncbi:MAG: exodeoxyribonuclease VII small subunit [Planctomycetota bacterium]